MQDGSEYDVMKNRDAHYVELLKEPRTVATLNAAFSYHPPKGTQQARYEAIRAKAKELAELVIACCPPGRESALARTNLEQAVMWANAAIARGE